MLKRETTLSDTDNITNGAKRGTVANHNWQHAHCVGEVLPRHPFRAGLPNKCLSHPIRWLLCHHHGIVMVQAAGCCCCGAVRKIIGNTFFAHKWGKN